MEYIFLSGEVGYEITPTILAEKFDKLKEKDVTIYISTIGGDAFQGIASYDFLKLQQKNGFHITTVATGIVASAGSLIYLAGNKNSREVVDSVSFLIHDAWMFTAGTSNELKKKSDELESLSNKYADIYAAETNLSKEEAREIMRDEEYKNADWLIKKGFASNKITLKAVASIKRNQNPKNSNMTESDKNWFEQRLQAFAKMFGGNQPNAKLVQDANGTELDFYELEADSEPKVGDKAKVDGKPAEGDYVMPDGKTFKFVSGELTEIVEASDDSEALKQQLADKDAEIESLKQQIADAQAKSENEITAMKKQFEEFTAEIKTKFDFESKGNPKNKDKKPEIRKRKIFR